MFICLSYPELHPREFPWVPASLYLLIAEGIYVYLCICHPYRSGTRPPLSGRGHMATLKLSVPPLKAFESLWPCPKIKIQPKSLKLWI